jgi:hypothetical protein
MNSSRRNSAFALLCLFSLVALAGYFYWARTRTARLTLSGATASPPAVPASSGSQPPAPDETPKRSTDDNIQPAPAPPLNSTRQPREIYFRHTDINSDYGKLARVDYGDLSHPDIIQAFSCQVVHFAGGHGVCLTSGAFYTAFLAQLFDSNLTVLATMPLNGVPSRTRVAADGKTAAITVFVSGHSYTSSDFTTRTLLVETSTARIIADLEDFKVSMNGEPFVSPDFNYWGVTFTPDSQHFYCTLSSNRKHYLVKGDIEARTATVLHENVECPSLSPDATRIAYKKRVEGGNTWQLHILELATMHETPLTEKRSVDDQLEWLDNNHVLYALPDDTPGSSPLITNVWVTDVDGNAAPRVFLSKAYSPAVVR